MKKLLPVALSAWIILACASVGQPGTPAGPSVETLVAQTLEALTSAAPPPATISPTAQLAGIPVSSGNVSFILPEALATNALAGMVPATDSTQEGPGWDFAPEHLKFQLENYALYDTFHKPYILVYPAQEYAALSEGASNSIAKIQAILNGSAAPTAENLPHVSSFPAAQVFAAQIQVIPFQGGSGVRFLTEYSQYYASANNRDLFYQFQGVTQDGKYYILAILPASHPLLAVNEDPAVYIPAGGIPFPGFDNENAFNAYYLSVENLLNNAAPASFNPALAALDALIQSIRITP